MGTWTISAATGTARATAEAWEHGVTAAGAVVVVLMVAAAASLLRTPGQDPVLRLLWLLVVLAFPVVGAALWFALGRRAPRPA
ncbi:PLDc N-terminal domain-containing protein [Kocuria flava]|uniref:PLDc N-terminal domain-containing protein n=1 Tax=Kocuria flava TaxID=446860 RepID=UPI001FF65293|nr:PLDc N-terminal domain-containing protein [Kocuria flava]MCJ8505120.1 PLDc N-terminal domain-containing protein [Kocuria flava]